MGSDLTHHGRNTTFDVPDASKFDRVGYAADVKVLKALPVWTGTPNGLSLWQNQKEAIALGAAYVRVSQQTGESEGALVKMPTGSGKSGVKLEPELDTALLGLVGEVGSLVSALKKKRRDTDGYLGYADAVLEELGDVLWYLSAVARRGGTTLVEAAKRAIEPVGTGAGEPRLSDLEPRARGDDAADRAFELALLQLAGEAGDLAKRFASGAYTNNVDALRGDMVSLRNKCRRSVRDRPAPRSCRSKINAPQSSAEGGAESHLTIAVPVR